MRLKLSSFLQTKPNLLIYKILGWKMAFYYILVLGRLYFSIKRREKRRIELSIQAALGHSKDQREIASITRDVFRGVFSHYYEKLFNAYEDVRKLEFFFRTSVEAPDLGKIDKALRKGKGVLFVTAHYGGIEYIPIYLATNGFPTSVIAKCSTKQLKDRLFLRADELGIKLIDATQKGKILSAIVEELKDNRVVFIECDEIEEWRPSRGEIISFLGQRVGVDRTINLLQRRTGAEIVFGLLHRHTIRKYSLLLEMGEEIRQRFKGTHLSLGAAVLKALEALIYLEPKQWYQWKHYEAMGKMESASEYPVRKALPRLLDPAYS
jgi:Kdo2-lipid IVA lauroyltransferase/acyltransferase